MARPEINHVGLTVSDLDRSIEFYSSLFHLEPGYQGEADGDVVTEVVGVPGGAMRLAILEGANAAIELIQYTDGGGLTTAPRTNDVGAAHICFPVADIDHAHAELVRRGARFVSPPSARLNDEGTRIAFLHDPDGIPVELVQQTGP